MPGCCSLPAIQAARLAAAAAPLTAPFALARPIRSVASLSSLASTHRSRYPGSSKEKGHPLEKPSVISHRVTAHRRGIAFVTMATAAEPGTEPDTKQPGTEPVEVIVKAAVGQPDQLGDCPFSQRVLLSLEEKGIAYTPRLVDTANKPQWFLDLNPEGKVPVIKRGERWVPDSDVITEDLEQDFPGKRSLGNSPEDKAVASGLFGAFARFLKGGGSEEGLLTQLQDLEDSLAKSGGPYVAGGDYTGVDARLTPALYHLVTALGKFKGWKIPGKFSRVLEYIEACQERESFKKTAAAEEVVVAGWARALGVTV